jgi:hypothetical protein
MRKLVSLLPFGIYGMSLKNCRMNYSFTTNVFYAPARWVCVHLVSINLGKVSLQAALASHNDGNYRATQTV